MMIARILTALLMLTVATPSLHAMPGDGIMGKLGVCKQEPVTTIKVLVGKQLDGAMLQATSGYNIFDPYTGRRVGTRFVGKSAFIQPTGNGLRWGEEFPSIYQVLIKPDPGSSLLVDGVQYRGDVYVYQVQEGLFIVNEVQVEDFLSSVLSTHFQRPMPEEAMNAMAISARTQAAYHVRHPANRYWHVKASDVKYTGRAVTAANPQVERALTQTAGLIMTHRGSTGELGPFDAQWTEHCGGKTAPYHVVFRKEGNAPAFGAQSPFAMRDRERAVWQFKVSKQDLATLLEMDEVTGVQVYADKESNKVYALRVESGRFSKDVDFLSLQSQLGNNNLQSSDFSISVQGDYVTFMGVGRGSGVGVCLFSAVEMAKRGQDASRILATFFPKSEFEVWKAEDVNNYRLIAEEDKRRNRGRRG